MSSMKKNVLAVALVAGLGLAGGAAAYNYGTLIPGNAGYNDVAESSASADLIAAEPVAYQEINVLDSYSYTMAQDIVWDFNPPDNAINYTQGFTARLRLADGALFDTRYTPTVYNSACATPGTPDTAYAGQDIFLDPTLTCTWDVAFDNYYEGGKVISIRITPKQGITNPQNPSSGLLLRYHNAHLWSLDEFYAGPINNIVHGEFWFINPSNDAPFSGSVQTKDILRKVSGVEACANSSGAETNKYIDVADSWLERQKPKTRFSFDGRLGSANDADGGTWDSPSDYNSQVIDLGNVTIDANPQGSTFEFDAGDEFHTVLTGDSGGWLAFENGPGVYNDDVYLVDGTCSSGSLVAQGQISGNTVFFDYDADDAGLVGEDGVSLTVCGFVDTDTLINDQPIHVTTTFSRYPHADQVFDGAACNLLPLRYNGSTMEVFTINAASNAATQRSLLRLTNRSQTAGWVRLQGIDDGGHEAAQQVSFYLEAGASLWVNSTQLENGGGPASQTGAWGAPSTGDKWRAVVTAEFPGLVASSFIRSVQNNVLSNITDSDTRGEQYMRDGIEGTLASLPGTRPSDVAQESTPDFRGNNQENGNPGGPNGTNGTGTGGTTNECGNPGMDNPPNVPGCYGNSVP